MRNRTQTLETCKIVLLSRWGFWEKWGRRGLGGIGGMGWGGV